MGIEDIVNLAPIIKNKYKINNMPLGKLIRTERTIFVYRKTKTKYYRKEIQEINVDNIPLDVLKAIVTPNDDDPLLYCGYTLGKVELNKLNDLSGTKITPNHDKFDYILECYGIYENDSNSNLKKEPGNNNEERSK